MSSTLSIGRFHPPAAHFTLAHCWLQLLGFMQVKQQGGKWLVRIEDIDPPREVAGANDIILRKQLDDHGLHWDDSIIYQSTQIERYFESIEILKAQKLIYHCECTRQRLNLLNGVYDNKCQKLNLEDENTSVRLSINDSLEALGLANDGINFCDDIMGDYSQS